VHRPLAFSKLKIEMPKNQLEAPHQKAPLTTPFGRLVERASYLDLLAAGAGTILLSSVYFWLAPQSDSLNKGTAPFSDAVYFSIVTFTSLGYGDLSPQGLGRFVAATNVLLGLVFIALLVGKFASERQQSILFLLHTSDCQRRLNEFTDQLQKLDATLTAPADSGSTKEIRETLKISAERLEVTSNYLIFNSNQARLVDFGNESALFALYDEIARMQRTCISIHKAEKQDLLSARRSLAVATRCLVIIKLMLAFHKHAVLRTSYLESLAKKIRALFKAEESSTSSPLTLRVSTLYDNMCIEAELLRRWSSSTLGPLVMENVRNITPTGPIKDWPVGVHKEIANQLEISNRLAQKCLDELIRLGKLPR
jgi:hypothetical protein